MRMVWIKGSGAGRTRGNSELQAYAEVWAGAKCCAGLGLQFSSLFFQQALLPMTIPELAVQVTSVRASAASLGETPPCRNPNALWEIEEFYIKLLLFLNKTVDCQMFSQHYVLCVRYSCHWVFESQVLCHLQHINLHILKVWS